MKVSVRLGDSLWYYSQIYGIPIQLMIDSNRTIDANRLQIGQEVNIPGFISETVSIKQGDTLWSLAKSRNVLPDAVFLLNQGVNPKSLQVGQSVVVPSRVTTPIVNGNRNYDSKAMARDIERLVEIYPFMAK